MDWLKVTFICFVQTILSRFSGLKVLQLHLQMWIIFFLLSTTTKCFEMPSVAQRWHGYHVGSTWSLFQELHCDLLEFLQLKFEYEENCINYNLWYYVMGMADGSKWFSFIFFLRKGHKTSLEVCYLSYAVCWKINPSVLLHQCITASVCYHPRETVKDKPSPLKVLLNLTKYKYSSLILLTL